MEQRKMRVDITREEKKKQLLKFIERKKRRIIPLEKMRSPLHENSKEQIPSVNKENVPRETETTYIEGSNRRKKRREKLQQIKEKREEVKKKRALAIQEKRQRREEERRRAREEQHKKKLEALKKKEEVRQLKEAKKKEKIKITGTGKPPIKVPLSETSKKPATSGINNNKKEELLALINKIKEKHQLEYTQRLLQKQVTIAEKKLKGERAREEQHKKKLEALKKKEEVRQLKEAKKKEALLQRERKTIPVKKVIPAEEKEIPSAIVTPTPYAKRKEELLEFLKTRKELYQQEKERKKVLRVLPTEKKKEAEIPAEKEAKVPVVILHPAITSKISALSREADKVEKEAQTVFSTSSKNINHFISTFLKKKEKPAKKPAPAAAEKKGVVKYREPFQLIPFIRRNIFKFVFLILLIGWLYEIFFFMGRFQDPQKRLSDIVGEDVTKQKSAPAAKAAKEKLPVTEQEFKIAFQKEKIDIEGRRDPFSPGRLTMQVFEKPEATNMVLASKPPVISILKPAKTVSIIEEPKMKTEKVGSVFKTPPPSYQPIVKDKAPSQTQPIEKVKPAEISALITPEKRCDLIYRGRLVIEGVEYLFIEGKNKTYRATIGDVVEGFRLLRKEKDKIYLSKDGIIYEIPVD